MLINNGFMKIGILTFHRALNYGAFLQSFALKTYMSSRGHESSIVDYWPYGHERAYKLFNIDHYRSISFISKIKYILSIIFKYRRHRARTRKMLILQQNLLNLSSSPEYRTPEQLSSINYDCLFYGSDQIWWKSKLKGYSGYDWAYWGDFVRDDIRRISYAASMGVLNCDSNDLGIIRCKLNNFDSISVRETSLRDLLQDFTNSEIKVVCDPVFLLSQDIWKSFCKSFNLPKRYILLFNLMHSPKASEIAQCKSKELQCPIIELTPSIQPWSYGKNIIQTADPCEFLYAINNAEFVVTSSFHCTAFSVIFNKQFYACGMSNNSGRVHSLLSILGIPDRIIEDSKACGSAEIDYNDLNYKLSKFVAGSKQFINNSLSFE